MAAVDPGSPPRRSPSRHRPSGGDGPAAAHPRGRPAASVRSRRKSTQRRVRGHIVWMVVFALLLFGVVAVNVAVLRAHVAVSKLDDKRAKLEAGNQALASQLLGDRLRAANRGGGAPARPDPGVGRQHVVPRHGAARPLKTRVVNSRLRLLLFLIVLTFAVLGARAAWIADRARVVARRDGADAGEEADRPAGRARDDLRPRWAIRSPSASRRSTSTPTRCRSPIRAARHGSRRRCSGSRSSRCTGSSPTAAEASSTSSGRRRRSSRPRSRGATSSASPSLRTRSASIRRGRSAAPVLGYAGTDNTGLSGLELQLNKELEGTPGSATVVRDALGQPVNTIQQRPARDGRDVFLTLDSHIQANAEQVLEQTVQEWHAKDATAIVLDPRTGSDPRHGAGAGLQRECHPAGDGARSHDRPRRDGRLRAGLGVQGRDHRRSPLATRHHAEHGVPVPGSLQVADRVIHDAEPHGLETLKVKQILQRSSNIGTDLIAERVPRRKRPEELDGALRVRPPDRDRLPRREPRPPAVVLVGLDDRHRPDRAGRLGHGASSSRRPTLRSRTAAIWMQPHLVDHVAGRPPARPTSTAHPRAAASISQLRTMLRGVVSDQGTAELAAIPGYSRRRQDGNGAEAGAVRLHPRQVRRDLRRDGAGLAARACSCSSASTSRTGRSTAASWRRRRSSRSPPSTSSTSRSRPTCRIR